MFMESLARRFLKNRGRLGKRRAQKHGAKNPTAGMGESNS